MTNSLKTVGNFMLATWEASKPRSRYWHWQAATAATNPHGYLLVWALAPVTFYWLIWTTLATAGKALGFLGTSVTRKVLGKKG